MAFSDAMAHSIDATGRARKPASKWQQLLASKATKGKTADAEKAVKEHASRKRPTDTHEETSARPLKITLHQPVQQETDTQVARMNAET